MAELKSFLRAEIGKPLIYGRSDCLLFASDWWLLISGRDPAADYRGTYHTETEAEAIIAAAGGIERLTEKAMANAGGVEVAAPMAGDVGLVRAIGEDGCSVTVGAVHTGRRWAARARRGVALGLRVEAARIWRWSDQWRW
ncbi:DUF6950 family protein [Brevundimonas nasdae]|uniref:DUF6950 domain-containing protein n=1 Tax=Brevundimonas nasdae TaxID=172043 RepID=A0ABX8TKF1_9CAUL|nr:hypothetical protein [Brevundimonas nasdae]QYC10558.1 hypothetical protein KWG56_00600 [Brevundimonas nasdae]QYC13345.1 hypothetical protein KWG63_14155 [Brevundimonas nasdae]